MIPKLNLKSTETVQETKDWYAYSTTLEKAQQQTAQALRELQDDRQLLTEKLRKQENALREALLLNQRLLTSLNKCKAKYQSAKYKLRHHLNESQFSSQSSVESLPPLETSEDPYESLNPQALRHQRKPTLYQCASVEESKSRNYHSTH